MKLTEPQLRELRLLAHEPQPNYSSARTRVHNKLAQLGLAETDPDDWARTRITERGYALLQEVTDDTRKNH
jgi:hypothetical protein